jgi:hypothetical protein
MWGDLMEAIGVVRLEGQKAVKFFLTAIVGT